MAVGSSAGGLEAFIRLLNCTPAHTGFAFVLLQHLQRERESLLPSLLAGASSMPVHEARDGIRLLANHVYVIPSSQSATIISRGRLRLVKRSASDVPSALIDTFMQSLAAWQSRRAVGVILSGNGRDGVAGLAAIRASGGVAFCQTPSSARNEGMPEASMAARVVDFALEPEQIARELARLGKRSMQNGTGDTGPELEASKLAELFVFLRERCGIDFSRYRAAPMRRRIARRMLLAQHDQLSSYFAHLQTHPAEAARLEADLLVRVTSFFRDPAAYAALTAQVLAPLAKACREGAVLRIWTPGCASGEEPYSIAMCLLECLGADVRPNSIQIFATDASEAAVGRARSGCYPATISKDVTSERLQRFFVRRETGYQIAHDVRELCVFARHDLLRDPAFSNLDLISCRNVLIYFRAEARAKVLARLRWALAPGGTLVLGASESLDLPCLAFERLDGSASFYRPRGAAGASLLGAPEAAASSRALGIASAGYSMATVSSNARKRADRILLSKFVPAAILVDAQLEVLQFRGETSPFIAPVSGTASLHILKLVDEALRPALHEGLGTVEKTKQPYQKRGLLLDLNGVPRQLDLDIVLVSTQRDEAPCYLIVFSALRGVAELGGRLRRKGATAPLIAQLRESLAMTRAHLQASLSEQEGLNESLRATLDELQATNEELQATNEELETGKEELQSANEELARAHNAVNMRNAELTQVAHDHVSLVAAASVAAILFGRELRLRQFTPLAGQLLALSALDIGRPIDELKLGLQGCSLAQVVAECMESERTCDVDAQHSSGRRFSLAIRPYRSLEGAADGVVMSLSDITALRSADEALARAERRIAELENTARRFRN